MHQIYENPSPLGKIQKPKHPILYILQLMTLRKPTWKRNLSSLFKMCPTNCSVPHIPETSSVDSKSETINHSLTDPLTGVGVRR